MAIKDIGSFQQTLGKADAKGWSRAVDNFDIETGKGFDIEETGKSQSFGEMLTESIS
jgi:flagellar hook-basal body complex protein FliE